MIRLELTRTEAEQLQQGLSTLMSRNLDKALLAPYQMLQEKLDLACRYAQLERVCPVCHNTFTQEKAGRTGHYCSKACKQKAYRERRAQWARVTGPPKR